MMVYNKYLVLVFSEIDNLSRRYYVCNWNRSKKCMEHQDDDITIYTLEV